mmetsp:Transcript_13406/g.14857  ORF Transcript_13406/g.14857 Transcript_13406/m.14857 type:complete len:204 (-) Transcript_13406:160-771(-)
MDHSVEEKSRRIVAEGRFLKIGEVVYAKDGKEFTWEYIERTTKKGALDSVVAIPFLKTAEGDLKLVMIGNYRPPVARFSLEFPAGLLEEDEDPVDCVLRELKEETGYVGDRDSIVTDVPIVHSSPWKSTECNKAYRVMIDGSLPENINPQQNLEANETIRVHLLDLKNAETEMKKLIDENNYVINGRIYGIIEGISFAKKYMM